MGDTNGAERRILARLGLATLGTADQLVLLLKRFRPAQLRDLEDALVALPGHVVAHIEAHFDRKLDVKDELERYAQDLLKLIHLMRHLQIDDAGRRQLEMLMGALGDGGDRAQLIKMVQALGTRLACVLSSFCVRLPHIRLQQDFYRIFATSGNEVGDLKTWMQWLESVRSEAEVITEFFVKCAMERCLALWLKLLNPLPSHSRVAVIKRLVTANASVVKQIGRFHDITALSVAKQLDLCEALHSEQQTLLAEFPTSTMLTLYAKFNNDRLVVSIVRALYLVGKTEVTGLIDTLAPEENLKAVETFVIGLVEYDRRRDAISLFLSSPKQTQSRIITLSSIVSTSTAGSTTPNSVAVVFHLLLDGHIRSIGEVLRKLLLISNDKVAALLGAVKAYTANEIALLGEGIEVISNESCLEAFIRLYDMVLPMQRAMLIEWVSDIPGEEALVLYNKLLQLYANHNQDSATALLQMMTTLSTQDKHLLCSRLLRRPRVSEDKQAIDDTNDSILRFLTACDASRRHKCVRLLLSTASQSHDTLLYLLRTQRIPEQVILTKVMLRLTPNANCRLLAKLRDLDGEFQDEFFQLLMLIPRVEYKMISQLLVSQEVTVSQLQNLIHVAANLMNQAASRGLVSFTAELPTRFRNQFFDILSQCTPVERGVVMRIVACSSRLPPEVAQLLVQQLYRTPWETRSALIEQVRALEDASHIQMYLNVLHRFEDDVLLPTTVHLLNLIPLPIRVSLVQLITQMGSVSERVHALAKLSAMPKDLMPRYCTSLCDPRYFSAISGGFLRVFAYLQEEYQISMLRLLRIRVCWVFVGVLTSTIDSNATEGNHTSLVNGFAASLTVLTREDDFVLLADVVEEAMDNGIRLDELVVVLAQFSSREQLLSLLNYVARMTQYTASTLFFRVLSRSTVTMFLFDMCHMLDLDDALFALQRIEQMGSLDHEALERSLMGIASRGSGSECRDEFCHFVLGYKEQEANEDVTLTKPTNTIIHPTQVSRSHSLSDASSLQISVWELGATTECGVECNLSAIKISDRPVLLGKQLNRTRSGREKTTNRRRHRNWREWTSSDWAAMLPTDSTVTTSTPARDRLEVVRPTLDEALQKGPTHITTEEEPRDRDQTHPRASLGLSSINHASAVPTSNSQLAMGLPPIKPASSSATSTTRPASGGDIDPMLSSPTRTNQLIHSESAMSSLRTVSRSKRHRGLHAALNLDAVGEFHVPHNRGASIFHKQCEYESLHGPSRIRVARTELALAKVVAARVDQALGRRSVMPAALMRSPLERADRLTIEQATRALAHGRHARAPRPNEVTGVARSCELG